MKKHTKKAKAKIPFFADILTKQEAQRTGGASTSPQLDGPQTQKYPSDYDETSPKLDLATIG